MSGVNIKKPGYAATLFIVFSLLSTGLAHAGDANGVIDNVEASVSRLPGLVTALAYLSALLFGVLGVFKIRDHVENPGQTPLREGLIRLIVGGALVALPIIYDVIQTTINGGAATAFDNTTSSVSDVQIGAVGAVIPNVAVDDVLENIIDTSSQLPGLLAGLSYLLGLVLAIAGIFKIREHIDNPAQNPLKEGIIRLVTGGALFALPTIFAAMFTLFTGGADTVFDPDDSFSGSVLGVIGGAIGLLGFDINGVLVNLTGSLEDVPGFITAVAYLVGLLMGVLGILKIKEHIDNPTNVPLREGVIRLVIGGAFFAIPVVYQAMYDALGGDAGVLATITGIIGASGFVFSADAERVGCLESAPLVTNNLGTILCTLQVGTASFPGFLKALAYLFGLVLGFWGLLKIRDHVLNPTQTNVSEGLSRLLAGGAFFALPLIIEVSRSSVTPLTAQAFVLKTSTQGFNDAPPANAAAALCEGLDGALACFMDSILGPLTVSLNFFGFVAGIILVMIGISRLIKSSQEGARGPGGLGTMMTFLAGGALMSFNPLLRVFASSLFGNPLNRSFAELQYVEGLQPEEVQHAHVVISAILKFMIIVGLISFVRGIFIVRNVAEGNQQASIMAGITHLVGGALAVNLGPLLNAVQETLGIVDFGVSFT